MILLLLFSILSTIRASNVQKPKPKNTLCTCADFFHGRSQRIMPLKKKLILRIFRFGQNMKNYVNSQEKLCNKIYENPRKGFLQLLTRGLTKLKNEYIFEPYVTQAFFCPRSWNVSRKKM